MSKFLTISVVLLSLLTFSCSGESENHEKPDDNRFTPVVLTSGLSLDEPMAFEVLKDERVFIIERKGGVKLFDPISASVSTIATIPVNTKYTSADGRVREAEEGLVGLTVHPDFESNPWIYLLYAHPDEAKHTLARWNYKDGGLVEASKVVMLEFPVQREECCHTGGGMVWDKDQNLFITIGNNTSNSIQSQTDERPNRSSWDDQRGAANTNDLRGKIIRIHPEDDGTYSIPEGNLYAVGTENTRAEIYSMGHRNAWRVSLDSKTGYIYWGEVGPDATNDTDLGPRGYDELNQGRGPGNHGWPYFVGENQAFPFYDFVADSALAPKDPANLINTSVNNTGLEQLPPALPAFISYPYGASERFPLVGNGGRSATGGPIYRVDDFKNPKYSFPPFYEGKWLAADLSRGWIMAITMDANGDYESMERFIPDYKPAEIIDIKFGPNGGLYILEYGSRWFRDSEDDKLVRIEFNPGNRKPVVVASTSLKGGKVPFSVELSGAGSEDFDGDVLKYHWELSHESSEETQTFSESNPTVSIEKDGVYTATLTVTDPMGLSNSSSTTILAGNEEPKVDLQLTGNSEFFFPDTAFDYSVDVSDVEDGEIDPSHVAMSINYVSEGFDYAEVIQEQRSVDASTRFSVARAMIEKTDCGVCHQEDLTSAGPSYMAISEKYDKTPAVIQQLASKVTAGGIGVWGEVMMPAHPSLSINDAKTIVDYILHVDDKTVGTVPLSGSFMPDLPEGGGGLGSVVVRAAYQDRGAGEMAPLSVEDVVILRSPTLSADDADLIEGARTSVSGRGAGPTNIIPSHGHHIVYRDIDLTGIVAAEIGARAQKREGAVGGVLEIRAGSIEGDLLGQLDVEVKERNFRPSATEIQAAGGMDAYIAKMMRGPDPSIVELKEMTGRHDLFFIFKNESARAIDPLMSFNKIEFKNRK